MSWYDHGASGWDYTLMALVMLAGAAMVTTALAVPRRPATDSPGADANRRNRRKRGER